MTQRIRERIKDDGEKQYALRQMCDEDEPDPLSRIPKCCVGRPPAPTMAELMIKHKLEPAERDMSRVRQQHDKH